jgi:hypothetical protein
MIYLPDSIYNPVIYKDTLSSDTLLQNSISISRFTKNSGVDYDNLSDTKKLEIAKNLYLHAELIQVVQRPGNEFDQYRLTVSGGLSFDNTGRAVIYELYDMYGNIATENTFDLANYLRYGSRYNEIILDYDNYSNGVLHASIIVIMPEIKNDWNVTFNYLLKTQYNNIEQSASELVEIRV